jgi:hypothetical protein
MPHERIADALGRTVTFATGVLLFVAITASILGTAGSAFAHAVAQGPPASAAAAHAENLTNDLAALIGRCHAASTVGQRAQLERDLLAAASIREQELAALVESDPASVLRVAVSDRVRAALPATVKAHVEEQIDIEGDLEILHEDNATGGRYHYNLSTASHGRLTLHFAADAPDLSTGARVRARGIRVQQTLALDSGASVQALMSVAPNTFGEQRTLVILVNFTDKVTQPYTVSQARDVVFNTTSGWDMENSYGQTWLTGDVVGWYTIPQSSTVCDYYQLAGYAKQAATAAGIPVSNYRRFVYGFPSNACTWWGLGTVGGNPSQAWIKGTFSLGVVGHEMGHNFGLYHSHSMDCGASVYATTCTVSEYGDTMDIMGGASSAHTNAYQKERLGWLNYGASPPLTTVTASGTYDLGPYEQAGSAPKALKILKSTDPTTGRQTFYYVEYRQPLGFDSYLSTNTNVRNGVIVHLATVGSGDTSMLLDFTPETSSWQDPALGVGWSYTDTDAGVTFTPISVSAAGAQVSVLIGSQTCVRGAPLVALSPGTSPWMGAGGTATYTVSVTNRDNTACLPAGFTLTATAPEGWYVSQSASVLTVSPGATVSATATITSPVSATAGSYAVSAAVSDSAERPHAGSATAMYVLASSLTVQASTDRPSYAPGNTVKISASVSSSDGAPVSGASVSVAVTRPDGIVATLIGTTGSTGVATMTLRTKKQNPKGPYGVSATATFGGVSGNASTSFNMQ